MSVVRSSGSRNDSVRKKVADSRSENGFLFGFMAKKIGIPQTSLSTWRTSKMDFIDEKLDKIEEFLKRYDK